MKENLTNTAPDQVDTSQAQYTGGLIKVRNYICPY